MNLFDKPTFVQAFNLYRMFLGFTFAFSLACIGKLSELGLRYVTGIQTQVPLTGQQINSALLGVGMLAIGAVVSYWRSRSAFANLRKECEVPPSPPSVAPRSAQVITPLTWDI